MLEHTEIWKTLGSMIYAPGWALMLCSIYRLIRFKYSAKDRMPEYKEDIYKSYFIKIFISVCMVGVATFFTLYLGS